MVSNSSRRAWSLVLLLGWAFLAMATPVGTAAQASFGPWGHSASVVVAGGLGAQSPLPAVDLRVWESGGLHWLAPGGFSERGTGSRPKSLPIPEWQSLGADQEFPSWRRRGAIIGGLLVAAAVYVALNSGVDSTQRCNQAANQDALETKYCVGLYLVGGVAGAGIGWKVGGWFADEH